MRSFRSLPVLAIRRMLGSWRLLSSLLVGSLVAGAVLASTVIYADLIRDLGLRFALEGVAPESLDVRVSQRGVAIRGRLYLDSRDRIEEAVRGSLGAAAGPVVREGTSATFYPTAPGGTPDLSDERRPRANLRFRSGLSDHTEVVAGRLPAAVDTGEERFIEALLGFGTASRNAIQVGDRFALHPFWDEAIPPIEIEVVGLVVAQDLDERYWGATPDAIDAQTTRSETLLFLVPATTFFGRLPALIPSTTATYIDSYRVDSNGLTSRDADAIAGAVAGLESRLSETEAGADVETELVTVLRTFDDKLFFVRIPLFVLLLQVGGIVTYFLMVVSTMVVERQTVEIATLRSRGASTAQLLAQYGVEAALLAGVGVVAGPPLAAAVISLLGLTPAFADLSGGALLNARLSTMAFVLAGAGSLLAFAAFMVPAWRATRRTIVVLKRDAARPRRSPLLLRLHLDVVLVVVLAFVFWRLRQADELFSEPLFGDPQTDPFLLATPAVAILTVGVVFLRLFPLVLRFVASAIALSRATVLVIGTRSLARNPGHYSRLILMLMLATSIGMFGATFSSTLNQSFDDRARYEVGADVRADDLRSLVGGGDAAFLDAVERVPAEVVSPTIRLAGSVAANGREERIELLGVEPRSFGEVAFFRGDFAGQSLDEMLATLSENATAADYTPLPDGVRQLGVWLKFPDIRGAFDVLAMLRGRDGRSAAAYLGTVRPGDAEREQWRFYALDLEHLRRSDGQPLPVELTRPLTLQSLIVRTNSQIGAQQGVVLFGPVLGSPLPPEQFPAQGAPSPASQAFAGATTVHDFTRPGFEPLQGVVARQLDDDVRVDLDAPPGFSASVRYAWLDSGRSPLQRGLRQRIDGEPTDFYLSRATAERLRLSPGDSATLTVEGAHLDGRFMGDFSLFPTYDAGRTGTGFAIVDSSRLSVDANAALPRSLLGFNSAWFASADPAETRAALADLSPQLLNDIERERLRQERDPLIAAGWAGILAISFGAVLLLAAIAFLVYSYLTAQQRRLEFAVLRTLGFSRGQVAGVVLLEHLFIIGAGMGLGTVVGLQVGRLMMDFFAVDEQGMEVLPPFVLSVSRFEVALVWGILGTVFVLTIAAVVLLYVRLALHRVLRLGDA